MQQILSVISTVFWGLVVLSILVYIHEGGHFIAARILGLRVKEFFIGMPCRVRAAFTSKRTGTTYGVTPILLGGYTLVCGMDGELPDCLEAVLFFVYKKGKVTVSEISQQLHLPEGQVEQALFTLLDWGSIEEVKVPKKKPQVAPDALDATDQNEDTSSEEEAGVFQTVARDAQMRSPFDKGHDFSEKGSTKAGEPHPFSGSAEAFVELERSRTFQKLGFWGRAFVLINGIVINIVAGFLMVVLVLSCLGVQGVVDKPVIGEVADGSVAAELGLKEGDTITSVSGEPVTTWTEMAQALSENSKTLEPFSITYEQDGVEKSAEIVPKEEGQKLGISASVETQRLSLPDAFTYAFTYIGMTASYIAQLLNPAHFQEVISQSSSVIGISVMANEAANQGIASFLLLAAAVSLSLGFMNLLPIPPLDGGKIVIEAISAIIKRPVPVKVQTIISYVGIILFIFLFIVLLRQDIVRFILGGN